MNKFEYPSVFEYPAPLPINKLSEPDVFEIPAFIPNTKFVLTFPPPYPILILRI